MIRRLLYLNGLATIGAVMNHASGWGFIAMFWWTDRYRAGSVPNFSDVGSLSYFVLRAVEQTVTFCPPAFLFVSGFFIAFAAGRGRSLPSWTVLRTRIRGLAIPYFIWAFGILALEVLQGASRPGPGFLVRLLTGRIVEPYYFVPLLVQLLLLSPIVVWGIRTNWKVTLVLAGSIRIVVGASVYPVVLGWNVTSADWIVSHAPGWFFPHGLIWFVLGVFGGVHLELFKAWLSRVKRVLPWLTVALGLAAIVEWELLLGLSGRQWIPPMVTLLDVFFACSLILAFMSHDELRWPLTDRVGDLGSRSFGIYLCHAPAQEIVSRGAYHFAPWVLASLIPFQLLLLVVGLGVPVLLMMLVNRSLARKYYTHLFG